MNDESGRDPTYAQQIAFSEAHDLANQLRNAPDFTRAEIGRGFLLCALSELRQSIGNKATAKLLYEAADEYAVEGD